jgi:hypothetical protein
MSRPVLSRPIRCKLDELNGEPLDLVVYETLLDQLLRYLSFHTPLTSPHSPTILDSYLRNVGQNDCKTIYRAKMPVKQNPKSEYRKKPRGPKQIQRRKTQLRNLKRPGLEFCAF